ncbi:patellin-4-like isoform X2 [Durio zibethinus]|uniref:Patellin-4-like isoform X2 n=1 Tax=Durio zibethinus TaxID=66656 RepID=A0A6P6B291_DURZI|nr:patellin-4-like isoform X2 [Durio zibethinus]
MLITMKLLILNLAPVTGWPLPLGSGFLQGKSPKPNSEMGKKREKINKAKESGKSQDQNMADEIEKEMSPEVQEANEIEYGKCSANQEPHEENSEEPPSFQEDEKKVAMEMKQRQKKALIEFRCRVEDAILGNYLLGKANNYGCRKESAKAIEQLKEITLWGVPLMPSKRHEGTDIVLLKFLKEKDYKVHEAFEMLRKTLKWRKEFKADEILEESLGPDFEKVAYLNSRDKEGHPLYYNIYGALNKLLGSEENCEKFLRLRVQYMEKGIKELNFEPGGTDSVVQIIDLKNSPGPATKELRSVFRKSWMLLQDHYPELIHRNIIINVPLWYYVSHVLSSRLKKTQRTNSKIVFARPGKVPETLLKFISPENLPVEYGGLKRENDNEFFSDGKVSEFKVRANASESLQIPAPEAGVTIVWDLTVVGWDVSYKEEFVPDDEGSYKVLLQQEKEKKMGESVRNSFYISEPGKIVITIDNFMLKQKKVLYRYKTKPTVPMYLMIKK